MILICSRVYDYALVVRVDRRYPCPAAGDEVELGACSAADKYLLKRRGIIIRIARDADYDEAMNHTLAVLHLQVISGRERTQVKEDALKRKGIIDVPDDDRGAIGPGLCAIHIPGNRTKR